MSLLEKISIDQPDSLPQPNQSLSIEQMGSVITHENHEEADHLLGGLITSSLVELAEESGLELPQLEGETSIYNLDGLHESRKRMSEELDTFFGNLKLEKLDSVYTIIDSLADLAHELNGMEGTPAEHTSNKLTVIANIKSLCIELFKELGIDSQAVDINRFIQIIISQEAQSLNDTVRSDYKKLNRLGTNEYKTSDDDSLVTSLVRFVQKKVNKNLKLGEYVMRTAV